MHTFKGSHIWAKRSGVKFNFKVENMWKFIPNLVWIYEAILYIQNRIITNTKQCMQYIYTCIKTFATNIIQKKVLVWKSTENITKKTERNNFLQGSKWCQTPITLRIRGVRTQLSLLLQNKISHFLGVLNNTFDIPSPSVFKKLHK